MKKIENWENVQATTDFTPLPAGGYVFKIVSVIDKESNSGKPYLEIKCDVAEGEYKDFANGNEKALRVLKAYYGEKSANMFKRFIERVIACNRNFKWDWNEEKLIGKVFGGVLKERQYLKENGEIGIASEIHFPSTTTVEKIRAKDFKLIPMDKLDVDSQPVNNVLTDDDCPF